MILGRDVALQVLEGMFGLAKRLFEVEVVAANGEAPTWHEDVSFFKVLKVRCSDQKQGSLARL